jgi:hypothetical protein
MSSCVSRYETRNLPKLNCHIIIAMKTKRTKEDTVYKPFRDHIDKIDGILKQCQKPISKTDNLQSYSKRNFG